MLGIDGPNYHQWDDNTFESTNVSAYAFWGINVRIFPPIYVRCEQGNVRGSTDKGVVGSVETQ